MSDKGVIPKTRKEREVWQACQLLWEEGVSVEHMTGIALGNRLVGLGYRRGSNTDIFRFKDTWVNAHDLDQVSLDQFMQESPLSSPIAVAVSNVEKELAKQFEKQKFAIEAAADKKIKQAETHMAKANAQLQQSLEASALLEEKYQQTILSNESLQETVQRLREERARTQTLLDALKNQYDDFRAASEKQAVEIKESHQKTVFSYKERIQAMLETHKKDINDYQSQIKDLRDQWISEADGHKVTIAALQREIYSQSQKIEQLNNALDRACPI